MLVATPGEGQFSAFFTPQSSALIDDDAPLSMTPDLTRNTAVGQQPTNVPSVPSSGHKFQPGTTVRSLLDGIPRVYVVTHALRSVTKNISEYKIRHLNQTNEVVVNDDQLEEITPEPADISISV